jgi:hypothetical protein
VSWGKSQVEFIPGLKLSELFYHEAVRPVLDRGFPGLPHSAALIGYGSDVLGYDTPVSRDHMWGPRLLLFLPEDRLAEIGPQVHQRLRDELPPKFYGYPTHFGVPDRESVRMMEAIDNGPVDHLVEINTVQVFFPADAWDRYRPGYPAYRLAGVLRTGFAGGHYRRRFPRRPGAGS